MGGTAAAEPVATTKRRARISKSPAATVRGSVNVALSRITLHAHRGEALGRVVRRDRVDDGAHMRVHPAEVDLRATGVDAELRRLRDRAGRGAAAAISALEGTQPVFRHSPPISPRSISTTSTPKAAAAAAAVRPAEPAPMTQMSGVRRWGMRRLFDRMEGLVAWRPRLPHSSRRTLRKSGRSAPPQPAHQRRNGGKQRQQGEGERDLPGDEVGDRDARGRPWRPRRSRCRGPGRARHRRRSPAGCR